MNKMKWAAMTSALGMVLAMTSAQAASDHKDYHASGGCKVYGSTPWTSLGFGWQGLFNTTTSPVNVICPIVKDTESAWDGSAVTPANYTYVHVHARSGNVAANVTCAVYTSYADGLTETQSISIPMAANNANAYASSGYLNSPFYADQGSMMLCQLGPKTALVHYTVYEGALSETP